MPIVKKLSDFLGEQVKQMRTNRSWLTGLIVGGITLGVTSTSHAQENVTFTSVTWNSFSSLFSTGTPVFGVRQLANETLSPAVSMAVGASQSLSFVNLQARMAPGSAFAANTGSSAATLVFNLAGASPTVSYTNSFYAINLGTSGGADADNEIGMNSGTIQQFAVTRPTGGAYLFGLQFSGGASTTITDNFTYQSVSPIGATLTYQGVIPEPATLALFGLGLAPIAVVIRRRRK